MDNWLESAIKFRASQRVNAVLFTIKFHPYHVQVQFLFFIFAPTTLTYLLFSHLYALSLLYLQN